MPVFGGTNPFDAQRKMEGVKNIIAVGAGKGGVGKSTVACQLALALKNQGKQVGILDGDIYGPCIPKMMGLDKTRPNLNAQNKIEPLVSRGIKTMSIGYLIEDATAVIWRGPMLFKAIDQFIRDVNWGELDYLVVDLPPGTGDVQLSIAQKVPVTGAVIVATPQDLALIDVKRCMDMFKKLKTPILGLIENMSVFVCPHCSKPTDLFAPGELHQFCEKENITVLAKISFKPELGLSSDSGNPMELSEFLGIASSLIEKLG